MGNQTTLLSTHIQAGAKIVDFGGWDMPIHYGSQIDEHNAVRTKAGMFDVSHMTVVDVAGPQAKLFLQKLLANDVGKINQVGKALYSAMLKEDGGVIDDLIIYLTNDNATSYRMVVNCSTRAKDLAWISKQAAAFSVEITERDDLDIIAVQGPTALDTVKQIIGVDNPAWDALTKFQSITIDDYFIGRTGYTGEDGVEIILPANRTVELWQALAERSVIACGLGARDTLRLEAGLNLYGSDMDESVSPLESNMAWTVAMEPFERDFIGRKALEKQTQSGVHQKLVGLVMETRGVLRGHQKVMIDGLSDSGEITSGTFSPTLGHSIAMARVPSTAGNSAQVEIRGKLHAVRVVRPPFVKNGEKTF